MIDWSSLLLGLGAALSIALVTWAVSMRLRDVSIVDSVWSIMIAAAAFTYAAAQAHTQPRTVLVLALVTVWAMRLSLYLTWRNWGEPEDYRYRKIRATNQPHFAWKSAYLVFGLQAVLAWIVSAPLFAALTSAAPLNWLDYVGVALFLFGLGFETVADFQLARFKADPTRRGQVLDSGLWAYTRHPNYFGECCAWWGFASIALAAGGAWSLIGPLLVTFLLLRISGVALLERDIAERRPAYRDYIARVNAFIPGPRRAPKPRAPRSGSQAL